MNGLRRFLRDCKIAEGRTLIVGSKIHEGTGKEDRRKLYAEAIGIDMEDGLGVDLVANLEECGPVEQFFAHIECTSVLEHSRRPWLLCENLQNMLLDGGTILVLVPWVWRVHNYPGDFFRYTPQGIEALLPQIRWEQQAYIVEERLKKGVPTLTYADTRWLARSELVMFGRK